MPRISLLIPAHNASRYIGKSVRSSLAALPADAEVVVLDDASTDRTARVVDRVRDPRVRLIRSEQSLGAAGAMRALLAATDSEFVARLDADDLCLPGRFIAQQREIDAGADVSFGNLVHFGRRYRGPKTGRIVRLSAQGVRLALLRGNPLGNPTMFGKRSAFGDDAYPDCATEDYATWLSMAARGVALVLSEEPFSAYRHHGSQLTKSATWVGDRRDDQTVVRAAYNRLCEAVLGITPQETHPIWAPWTSESGADLAVVAALRARVDDFSGAERDYLRLIFG